MYTLTWYDLICFFTALLGGSQKISSVPGDVKQPLMVGLQLHQSHVLVCGHGHDHHHHHCHHHCHHHHHIITNLQWLAYSSTSPAPWSVNMDRDVVIIIITVLLLFTSLQIFDG